MSLREEAHADQDGAHDRERRWRAARVTESVDQAQKPAGQPGVAARRIMRDKWQAKALVQRVTGKLCDQVATTRHWNQIVMAGLGLHV